MWFEDVEIGATRDLGSYTFTADAIIAFAKQYDPQIFHIDADAAKETMFGGLIASGWHTAAIFMKLVIAERERARAAGHVFARSGVSPGFEDMRWIKPVRAGMTLHYTSETIEKVELKSRKDIGLVKTLNKAHDEAGGELVFSFVGKGFVQRRPAT